MLDNKLLSERAEHFIANYQIVNDNRTFRVESYYKKYSHLVKYSADGLDNSGDGYARGIEFFWRDSKTLKDVDYWISYSFLDTERDYRISLRQRYQTLHQDTTSPSYTSISFMRSSHKLA